MGMDGNGRRLQKRDIRWNTRAEKRACKLQGKLREIRGGELEKKYLKEIEERKESEIELTRWEGVEKSSFGLEI